MQADRKLHRAGEVLCSTGESTQAVTPIPAERSRKTSKQRWKTPHHQPVGTGTRDIPGQLNSYADRSGCHKKR